MSETIDINAPLEDAPPKRLVRVDEAAGPAVSSSASAATSTSIRSSTGSPSPPWHLPAVPVLLLYVAAWFVMPSKTSEESVAVETLRRHRNRPWLLLRVGLLAFFAIFALPEARFWPGTGGAPAIESLLGSGT